MNQQPPSNMSGEATGGVLRGVLELGNTRVLGRGEVRSDSDKIALLRLAYFEGIVKTITPARRIVWFEVKVDTRSQKLRMPTCQKCKVKVGGIRTT